MSTERGVKWFLKMTRLHVKYQMTKTDPEVGDRLTHAAINELKTTRAKEIPFWKKVFRTVLLIGIYFVLSVGLTFYQQWLYNSYGFDFPLGVVVCHLVIKFLISGIIRAIRKWCTGSQEAKVQWQNMLTSIAPPGVASGLDVGLSNWAISLITMSLYTMTKSTTIIFILGFSLVFKLEKKSWSLMCIVVMISGGLVMFTYKSTQFGLLGFALCLLASFCSGVRWTMTQLIMQRSKLGLRNPVDMMYYMQPWMLLPIIPATLWFEGSAMYNGLKEVNWTDSCTVLLTTSAIVGGALLAFHMELMEFLVVTYTSSLTLSISGILKEICILILAFAWKGERMSGLNFIGLLLCLGGIVFHVVQKVLASKHEARESLELRQNLDACEAFKIEESGDLNLPLLSQKSTSLTNLLTTEFSTDDEEVEPKNDESPSQILSHILQRREQ